MVDKKIIKAKDVESSGANVEKVELALRKFNDKVFKKIPLDEQPVAMEDEVPSIEFTEDGEVVQDGDGEHQVRIERFYDDGGELQGLQITCRCGEVIDLEFTRDEDEVLPESAAEQTPQDSAPDEFQDEMSGQDESAAAEQPVQTGDQPDDSELELEQLDSAENPSEEQISVDNGTENTKIEEN